MCVRLQSSQQCIPRLATLLVAVAAVFPAPRESWALAYLPSFRGLSLELWGPGCLGCLSRI